MGICDKITYIVDTIYKAGFTSLTGIFIYQLSNFHKLQTQGLNII